MTDKLYFLQAELFFFQFLLNDRKLLDGRYVVVNDRYTLKQSLLLLSAAGLFFQN